MEIITEEDEEGTLGVLPVQLKNNGSVTVAKLPLGGETGTEAITYYIFETDKDGKRINPENFTYKILGNGQEITFSKFEASGSVTLTNQQIPTVTPTPTPTITPPVTPGITPYITPGITPPGNNPPGTTPPPVQTGDESNLAVYTVILLLALTAILTLARKIKN